MRLKYFLVITAVVMLCQGIYAMLLPATVLSQYGVSHGPVESFMARYAALGTFVMGLLALFSRGVEDDKAKRAVTITLLIANAVGVVISVASMISGVIGATGWVVIGFYLFFVIGYAYFHFKKPKDS
ncbi:MAG: hypothetical protein WAU81_15675 [Candidatus Aminicenantales bacterium]